MPETPPVLLFVSSSFCSQILRLFPLFSFTFLLLSRQAGIGTDATMHDHIKKLLDRNYATKDANSRFKPTALVRRMERRGMVGEGRGEEKRQFEFHQCFIVF